MFSVWAIDQAIQKRSDQVKGLVSETSGECLCSVFIHSVHSGHPALCLDERKEREVKIVPSKFWCLYKFETSIARNPLPPWCMGMCVLGRGRGYTQCLGAAPLDVVTNAWVNIIIGHTHMCRWSLLEMLIYSLMNNWLQSYENKEE